MRTTVFLLFLLMVQTAFSQELARFTVRPQKGAGLSPVAVSLDGLNYNTDNGRIALFLMTASGEKEVPSQLESGQSARLWFVFDNKTGEKKYVIRTTTQPESFQPAITLHTDDQTTTVWNGNSPVLSYQHAVALPPAGVDLKYKRSGFIHPLYSPGGEVLTRIQAPDHYHHYGIWNPWTKTNIDGREVDFWNLYLGQGTVKFAGYLDAVEGNIFSGFKVRQEHVYFLEGGGENTALNEVWDVRVWNLKPGISVVDLTTTLNSPLPNGILLDAYRYGGGIGYRATEKWHKENCTVLTSEGKNRAAADGTNARWCITEGESAVKEGRSGILFLSHPANRMHPEPMRVWPPDANGNRGDMYFEFCPIRHQEWKIEPEKNYTLKYRMIVFDGKITPEEAEMYWKSFASAPKILLAP